MNDQQSETVSAADNSKGKGKAIEKPTEDLSMDEDDSSEEESAGEENGGPEEPDEDNMEEIDTDNIVKGRTRGKNIDFAKAAADNPDEDEDDDDDDDFEAPEEDDEMKD